MANQITQTVAAFKLLASPKNIEILRALKDQPSKAKDLECVVDLDRMSIKRRLYKLVAIGLVEEEKVKSKKTKAIVYHTVDKSLTVKTTLFQMLDSIDTRKISKMTRI